ncbi:glycosyltransferase-like protein LARGE [Clonorchis sinensis]|uniref:Glycosyltransferase-like protein LARGE n=1 Tax=Clonorchis sinensis TaxID=79923 RepID=G7Y2L9_CLOSI|nr:glycosyltransferase-like protein LARGE [Clonorchis sinensis]
MHINAPKCGLIKFMFVIVLSCTVVRTYESSQEGHKEECQPTHGVRVSGGADICMDGSKRDEIIHTFSVLHGASAVYQAVTLLKSILYSQGQFKDHLPECLTGWIRHKDINCVHHSPSPRQYLNMHWVVDQGSRGLLVDLKLIGHARTKHYAGYSAMMKLMAPYIVDSNVQKVIVLDVDLLFNDDIKELWKYFSQFEPGEAIGAVCEQSGECQASCSSPAVPPQGINTGVMLLDVSELRAKEWRKMWWTELNRAKANEDPLWQIDQACTKRILDTEEAPPQLRTDDVSSTVDETFATPLPSSANRSTAI